MATRTTGGGAMAGPWSWSQWGPCTSSPAWLCCGFITCTRKPRTPWRTNDAATSADSKASDVICTSVTGPSPSATSAAPMSASTVTPSSVAASATTTASASAAAVPWCRLTSANVGRLVVGPTRRNASMAPVDAPLPSSAKATGVMPAAHR
jgi:hypothetical protein